MKKNIALLLTIICLLPALQSCIDNENKYYAIYDYPDAIVTVKPIDEDAFYMQLDDTTTLLPVNMGASPYGDKEVRALVSYYEVKNPDKTYSKAVHVNWIDSILTKPMAADKGLLNDSIYGNDPVEVIRDRITIAEDGYLTLRFRTQWSGRGIAHYVYLVGGTNPDNPYEVEFRHDARHDTGGIWADGLVAFRLDSLPDTNGETVKLTLTWMSYSGKMSLDFDYCTRRSTPAATQCEETPGDLFLQ